MDLNPKLKSDEKTLVYENSIPDDDSFFASSSKTRLLHIYHTNWSSSKFNVIDSDKSTILLSIDCHMRKPHMRIHLGDSHETDSFATVNFRSWKSDIQISINSHDILLTTKTWACSHGYDYTSPTFNGNMRWKPRSKWDALKMELLAEDGTIVARFEPSNWAKKKCGKLELTEAAMSDEKRMQEVVVTALAVMKYRINQRNSAAAAGGGAGA